MVLCVPKPPAPIVYEAVYTVVTYRSGFTNRRKSFVFNPLMENLALTVPRKPTGPFLDVLMVKDVVAYLGRGERGLTDYEPRTPNCHRFCGVAWYCLEYVNSCSSNGFLSAFLLAVRLTRGRILGEIRIHDGAMDRLRRIATHVLEKGNTVDDNLVKEYWFGPLLAADISLLPRPIDVRGHEISTIFQHLLNHGGFNIQTRCVCGIQVFRTPHLEAENFGEFLNIQNVLNGLPDSYPSLASCLTCGERRQFVDITPIGHPWLIHVSCSNMKPKELAMFKPPLWFQDSEFELAYLSLVEDNPRTRVSHQTTLHFLEGRWYYYDSQLSPLLHLVESEVNACWVNRRLTGVTYFKRVYRGPGFHKYP